jgi:hypothetical protein
MSRGGYAGANTLRCSNARPSRRGVERLSLAGQCHEQSVTAQVEDAPRERQGLVDAIRGIHRPHVPKNEARRLHPFAVRRRQPLEGCLLAPRKLEGAIVGARGDTRGGDTCRLSPLPFPP